MAVAIALDNEQLLYNPHAMLYQIHQEQPD
jgi:hypothetical protein